MFSDTQPGYRRLRSIISERTNRLVVWIGAGLSVPSGLPSWSGLRNTLCQVLVDQASTLDTDELVRCQKRADQIRAESDYWLAFQMLRDALGKPTYSATVRSVFRMAESCAIPESYRSILGLPITGILNLNIDRLATRAFTEKYAGKPLAEFGGFQSGQYVNVLQGATPFIANLHGIVSDASSWVLCRDDFRALRRDLGYETFVRSCLASRTVIFVGISADDVAAGGHIESLVAAKIDLGDHFWITDRIDGKTKEWADRANLQMIRYRAKDGDHSELRELLDALRAYQSKDDSADPVTMTCTIQDVDLPSPDVLQRETDAEKVREQLNAHAATLLAPTPETGNIDYGSYDRFCAEYDEAIYQAWYVTTIPPRNKLFGYTLDEEIADGAFGRVFRAHDQSGRSVAIKVLREDVRRKPDMLQSFRRGVRSMRILAQRRVEGMIPPEEASEIPAVVIMEFVEGPNLQEAVERKYINDWASVLEVSVQIAKIIRRGHLLPERVLHRDLRPPNVMLKDYYSEPETLKVVILDFDLSWHLGAQGVSVVNRSTLGGFLAPEQVDPASGMSTRSAAVDSFGMGMTLYYLLTGQEPHYMQHLHKTWEDDDLQRAISRHSCASWQSVPVRFARLILNSTRHNQSERWDMGQIEGELQQLRESDLHPAEVSSSELLADELAERVRSAGGYERYQWDPDKLCAAFFLLSGVNLHIAADATNRCIDARVEWSRRDGTEHKNVKKYLASTIDSAVASLRALGWKVLPETHMRGGGAGFAVRIGANELAKNLPQQPEVLADVLRSFHF